MGRILTGRILLAALVTAAVAACVQSPPLVADALADMPLADLHVDGASYQVRLAATDRTRASGFQHVPAAHMDDVAIYFQFDEPLWPSFHMHNVAAPLLIAWIGRDGRVLAVDLMTPGGDDYPAPAPIIGALEYTETHPLAAQVRPGSSVVLHVDGAFGTKRRAPYR